MESIDLYADPLALAHDAGPGHPECPERFAAVTRRLAEPDMAGLVESVAAVDPLPRERLLAVHTARHVELVMRAHQAGGGWLDGDTHMGERSVEAALVAAGQCVAAARAAATHGRFAFCAIRPPGHHATPSRSMGFCLFNNVALAARCALQDGLTDSVVIVDWDVHHGNGTQECFEGDRDVFFMSVHQHLLYPMSGEADDNGVGPGEGWTVNVPLPAGSGGEAMRSAVSHVACRAIDEMRPGVVLVSAGYDGMKEDPLAELQYRAEDYRRAAAGLAAAARRVGAGLVCCLEGGYHLGALSEGVAATVAGMTSPEPDGVEMTEPARRALGRCFCGRP